MNVQTVFEGRTARHEKPKKTRMFPGEVLFPGLSFVFFVSFVVK